MSDCPRPTRRGARRCGKVTGVNITELVVGVAILAGVVGIVVPVLPGSLLILGAVLV